MNTDHVEISRRGPAGYDDQSSAERSSRTSAGRRRGVRAVAGLLAVGLVSGGVGWVAARRLRSPADVAARTAPPPASRLTAPVELRVLRSTLFTRGTVRFGSPRPVTLPASSLKSGSLVVTAPPAKGTVLREGSKAADVGGRPVVVLVGSVPMYRDIRPGDKGPDVAELKTALGRLGFDAGPGDVYDERSERAVSVWMRKVGYDAFGPTDTQNEQLRTSSDAATKAGDAVRAAQQALAKAREPVGADKVLAADEAVRAAQDHAASARSDREKQIAAAELALTQKQITVASATATLTNAQAALVRAQSDLSPQLTLDDAQAALTQARQRVVDAETAVLKASRGVDDAIAASQDADQAVADAEITVSEAETALANAKEALEKQKLKPPPTIVQSPGVYMIDTDTQALLVRQAEAAVTTAAAALRSAQAGLRSAQRNATKAVQAIDDARNAVPAAQSTAQQARDVVKTSELRVTQAQTNIANTAGSNPSGGSSAAVSVVQAQQQLDQATAQLGVAQRDLDQATKELPMLQHTVDASIRAADAQVRIAVAQRSAALRPSDVVALTDALAAARDAKRRADADLALLEANTGIVVPANEVLFFPALPLRVDDTKLSAGDALSGALMTVASQRLAIDASVDPADAPSLHVGQTAEIEATDLNIILTATISRIASQTGTDGVGTSRIYVELTPTNTINSTTVSSTSPNALGRKPVLSDLNGLSVKVTIPISTTRGKVLAVPTTAVSAAADGTTRVEVEDSASRPTRFVTVTVGLRAEGYVEITPIPAETLRAGDLVVTGTKNTSIITGSPGTNDQPVGGATVTSDTTADSNTGATPSEPADTAVEAGP